MAEQSFFDRVSSHASHVPDVLSCIANLSNDEVFTPPEVVNKMLDLLPQELFADPKTTFLDPATKTGVFLREIAKRCLEAQLPGYKENSLRISEKKTLGIPLDESDIAFQKRLQDKIDHIFHNQLFGIGITELTSLLARRSLYCSKYPNGPYSITHFDNPEGNIRFRRTEHAWQNGKCVFCGVSNKTELGDENRGTELETHAYEFIHLINPEEIFKMQFDVIICNPPYQLKVNETGKGLGAVPIYHKFIEQAQKLNSRYISMIIPARWFSGGVGLEDFRKSMLTNKHISKIVDYIDSKDCFPGVDINGGVCYFLIDKNYSGVCDYTNISNGKSSNAMRNLNEFDIFIRRNEALSIVHKVVSFNEKTLAHNGGCSPQTPYGFLSTFVGNPKRVSDSDCELLSSKGWTFVSKNEVLKSKETISMYKPMISKLSCEHAGNPDKNGMYRVLSRMELLKPNQICSQSYLTVCPSMSEEEARNTYGYLRTKFVRFLILQTLVGMNLSISNFKFVPWQDFTKSWTDEELYAKYGLTDDEIAFIESMII